MKSITFQFMSDFMKWNKDNNEEKIQNFVKKIYYSLNIFPNKET